MIDDRRKVALSPEPATKKIPRKRRRILTPGRIIGLIILLGIGAIIFGSYQLVDARRHLQSAANDLSAVTGLTSGGSGLENQATRLAITANLTRAQQQFSAAHHDLWLWSPILSHLGWVPSVGEQLQAAFPLSDAGSQSSTAALELMTGLHKAWPELSKRGGHSPLLARLTPALAAGQPSFAEASGHLDGAISSLRQIPSSLGNAQLDQKLHTVRVLLPGLLNATKWLSASPTIFGASSPSHILLVWENPRELRAAGGFIPAENYITINRGKISADPMGAWLPHQPLLPVPAPEAMYTAEDSWLFEDSNWSPDFPLSARYERWTFGRDTGKWAPMVVDVLGGAPDILAATGPLYLTEYHREVTAGNVAALIEYYHHHNNARDDTQSQRFLAVLLRDLLARVQSLNLKGLFALGSGLSGAIAKQHLLMYDQYPSVETAINSVGAGGQIEHPLHDSLYIVDDNRSYNKINSYVREAATYDVAIDSQAHVNATLTIRYHLLHTPKSLLGAGALFGNLGTKHDYQDFVRVYVPPGSTLQGSTGWDNWAPVQAYGLTQFSGRIFIKGGQTHTVVLHYRVPTGIFLHSGVGQYALTVQRQPGADLSNVRVVVHAGKGVALDGPNSSTQITSLSPLHASTDVTAKVIGVSPSSIPSLPAQPWHGDPYLPNSVFKDPAHPL